MYDQFLKPVPEIYKENENLTKAIIVDIDGTLAFFNKIGKDNFRVALHP